MDLKKSHLLHRFEQIRYPVAHTLDTDTPGFCSHSSTLDCGGYSDIMIFVE